MTYITNNKAITVNGQTWFVNSSGSGLRTEQLKAIINQVDAMLTHHSKVFLMRFDLRMYNFTDNNEIITTFNRRLHKWLKRKYILKRVGFHWVRELETAKQQHYHYALMIDGHKARHPIEILNKVQEIWNEQLGGSMFTPKNCYYNLEREKYSSIQNAIWRLSYLAKARGKGYKPAQTKNYGASRITKR